MKTLLQKTSKIIFLGFFILLSFTNVNAQIVSYSAMTTITCPAAPVATISPSVTGLTFSQISRGSGVTCATGAGSISGSGFNGTLTANSTASKWYTFTITSDAATSFNLNSLSIVSRASNATGANVSVQYSISAGAKTVIGSYIPTTAAATYVVTPTTPILVAANQVISIFIIPNGLTAAGTTCRVENNTSVSVSLILGATTPSVTTTSSATLLTSTSATLAGNVTATGGSDITANGSVFAQTSIDNTPTIGEASVTNLATVAPSISTGSFSNPTGSILSANTQYSFNAYAINAQGTSYGTVATFYTLANVPSSAFISNPTTTTLDVTLGAGDGNPATTQYAIQVGSLYVQASGSLGATAVWQTASVWGTKTVTGLLANTSYIFAVKARNGANVETAFSTTSTGTTLPNLSPSITQVAALQAFGTICVNVTSTNSFSFDGANLDGTSLVVNAASGFSYSLSQTGTFTSSLNISYTGTSISNQVVWVKFAPTLVQSYLATISISGGGLVATFDVVASGSGANTPGVVTTTAATSVTVTGATLSGSASVGCSAVISSGIQYGTNNLLTTSTSVAGTSATITGLNANTTYYFRAFATDASGTVNGAILSFTTSNLSAPLATAGTAIQDVSFIANWDVVEGATSYKLDVSSSPTFGNNTPATDLIISEYLEGSSNNKALEIYNGTGATVNLSNYSLRKQVNGVGVFGSELILTGTLANGATYVIANSLSNASILAKANLATGSGVVTFNGNDAVALYKSGVQIDMVGVVNQVTNWGLDVTLVRNAAVLSPTTTYALTDWTSFAVNSDTNLGLHTMNNGIASYLPGYDNLVVTGTSQLVTGLTLGQTYYYRVAAVSTNSTSLESNAISVITVLPIKTKIINSQCGATVSNVALPVFANAVAGATSYRFKVTNVSTSNFVIYESVNRFFKFTNLTEFDYASTYSIGVELQIAGVWIGYYGDNCLVATPTIPNLAGVSCNSTIINQFTGIYTANLPGVTSYKFRITNLTSGIIEEETNIYNWFNFNMLDGFVYGTTYSVEVAVKTAGTNYSAYGAPCNVSTPAVPGLLATSCGATINSNTAGIYTTYLNNVTTYRFELSNPTTGIIVQVIDRATNWFNFSQVTGHVAGTSYSVRLKLLTKGVYSDWGPSCIINPGAGVAARFGSATTASSTGTEFKAVGYPNPFESNFTLNVTTASDDKVQVAVYDMIGKQLESKEVNAADASALEVGANYPSGVYNVVVSQGANVKSLRMIKR